MTYYRATTLGSGGHDDTAEKEISAICAMGADGGEHQDWTFGVGLRTSVIVESRMHMWHWSFGGEP